MPGAVAWPIRRGVHHIHQGCLLGDTADCIIYSVYPCPWQDTFSQLTGIFTAVRKGLTVWKGWRSHDIHFASHTTVTHAEFG